MTRDFFISLYSAVFVLALTTSELQAVNVIVAYQTEAEPAKVAQAENSFAKMSGATVDWRKFDSGSGVLRALASGDVQIGNLGSSPLAVGASQKLPIEVFLIASQLGSSEALVVKNQSIRHKISSENELPCRSFPPHITVYYLPFNIGVLSNKMFRF